ncbi:hypothetical protein ACVMB1_004051 [Bradyrhizobium sp. USDA 4504]
MKDDIIIEINAHWMDRRRCPWLEREYDVGEKPPRGLKLAINNVRAMN